MASQRYTLLATAICALLSGCTIKLPLCPTVANVSYPEDTPVSSVNWFVLESSKKRNLSIEELSEFVAIFSGSPRSIRWLEENYPSMLCAFKYRRVVDDEGLYTRCIRKAGIWIDIVKDERFEELMLRETDYAATCIRGPALEG